MRKAPDRYGCGIVTPKKEIIIVSKIHDRIPDQEFWYIPKGKMEEIDNNDEEHAAHRESSEETGIRRGLVIIRGRLGDFPELGLTNEGKPNLDDMRTLKLWSATTEYDGPLRSKEPDKHPKVIRMNTSEYGDYFKFDHQRRMIRQVIKSLMIVHAETFGRPSRSARKNGKVAS